MTEPCERAPAQGWTGDHLHAPAPAKRGRHTEWNRQKMVLFLRELAVTQCVSQAARAVGMSRTSAYRLRNRMQHTPFALGWEVALEMGLQQLAHAVMDRALNGVEVQHYYHGELVATTRRYDNRLAQWLLENPWKVGRHQIAREWSSRDFEALLDRIESDHVLWTEDEALPGRGWPYDDPAAARAAQDRFVRDESWYAAEARWDQGKRPAEPKPGW